MISRWEVRETEEFLTCLAQTFEGRTGLAAIASGTVSNGRVSVPRLGEGLSFEPDTHREHGVIALWDGFPPNPYLFLHMESAARDVLGDTSPDFPQRYAELYGRPWTALPLRRRLVLRTRFLWFLWSR